MFWKIVFFFRLKQNKEELEHKNERFGLPSFLAKNKLTEYKKYCLEKNLKPKIIWLHAVSVGESLSVIGLVEKLVEDNYFVVFTTTTKTSAKLIREKTKSFSIHQYNPYPKIKYIKKFLSYWQPNIVFFVESEIFPNIVNLLYKQKIKTYLINARMSIKSFEKWKKIKFYISKVLTKYTYIFALSENEKTKFDILSKNKAKTICLGNLKLDTAIFNKNKVAREFKQINEKRNNFIEKCNILKEECGAKKIIVFGSIHKEEFLHIIWQVSMILKKINCLIVFTPRYIEQSKELNELCKDNGLKTTFWDDNFKEKINNILIVDKLGVLMYLYNICDIAVVCGSFAQNIGGHNPLEPIVFNKPTFIGNYCHKCQELVDLLKENEIIYQTNNLNQEIIEIVIKQEESNIVKKIENFIKTHKGTLERIYKFIFD